MYMMSTRGKGYHGFTTRRIASLRVWDLGVIIEVCTCDDLFVITADVWEWLQPHGSKQICNPAVGQMVKLIIGS